MKFGLGLYGNMMTSSNFRFARQAGATHIVAHVVGYFNTANARNSTVDQSHVGWGLSMPDPSSWTYEWMRDLRSAINAEGLELEAIENFEPGHWFDVLLDGPRKQEQMETLKRIIRDMGRAGIAIMGYNFSLAGVWGRDSGAAARGAAGTVGFHAPEEPPIPLGMVWNMVYDPDQYDPQGAKGTLRSISREEFMERYAWFLNELVPVAEEANVRLALHPDDPPMPTLRGTPRLVYQPRMYKDILSIRPSHYHAMELCLGTVAEMSEGDIYEMVDTHSKRQEIAYIHFRNVKGKVPHYDEVFIDEGDVDMIRLLRILHKNNYNGVLIPDHTPSMSCDAPWHAGMAYALGYMRAAVQMINTGA